MADKGHKNSANAAERQSGNPLRLLLPVSTGESTVDSIKYVLYKHELGIPLEVSLLYVIEPLLRPWDILRFHTEQEVAKLRTQYAQILLNDAAAPFRRYNIRYRTHCREGDTVFEILDAAEQLNCDRIIIKAPLLGWRRMFSRNIARRLLRRQRTVPVVTIDKHGLPIYDDRECAVKPQ